MLYFDSVATTPIKQSVYASMIPYLTSKYGNSSSKYSLGYEARQAIEEAREKVATSIGADPSEIFFTSCGSESNTWALNGVKKTMDCTLWGKALVSSIEHHSVLNAINAKKIDVDEYGKIIEQDLIDKITDKTYIISCMYVNNEVGTIQPIESIAAICKEKGIFFHVDAVQALGHMPINLSSPHMKGITTLSISGHKIGAPKGIGALFIRKEAQEHYGSLIVGGQQEKGLRGGTENVASIVGLGKACELLSTDFDKDNLKIRGMNIYAWDFIKDNIPNCHLNGLPLLNQNHIANILNVSIDGINGEEMVALLDSQGICISTGSACNSDSGEPSHVLKAMGMSDNRANSSIRISFTKETQLVEVNELCQKLVENAEMLRD